MASDRLEIEIHDEDDGLAIQPPQHQRPKKKSHHKEKSHKSDKADRSRRRSRSPHGKHGKERGEQRRTEVARDVDRTARGEREREVPGKEPVRRRESRDESGSRSRSEDMERLKRLEQEHIMRKKLIEKEMNKLKQPKPNELGRKRRSSEEGEEMSASPSPERSERERSARSEKDSFLRRIDEMKKREVLGDGVRRPLSDREKEIARNPLKSAKQLAHEVIDDSPDEVVDRDRTPEFISGDEGDGEEVKTNIDEMTKKEEKEASPYEDEKSPTSGSSYDDRSPIRDEHSDTESEHEPVVKPSFDHLPKYYPAIQGCRSVEEFQCLNRIDEGTYGVVYRAMDKKTGDKVALKRLKMEKEKEGFPITSLREINTLLKGQHQNIVTVREIVVGSNMDKIYIVMDYVEHDLKTLMSSMKSPFRVGEVKTLMVQLLRAIQHLHDNWILHRDLKTSNLLLSHQGILKVGDFGLAREYGSPLKPYTPVVVTLWYRSPELLLGAKMYKCPIDLWSCGCIFAEFLTLKPLFPAKSEIDALGRIFKMLGTPSEKIWPGVASLPNWKKFQFAEYPYNTLRNHFSNQVLSEVGAKLMNSFLCYDPEKRIDAVTALEHPYFKESPLPVPSDLFPTWPAKSEGGTVVRDLRDHEPTPPEAGVAANARLEDDEVEQRAFGFSLNFKATSQIGFQLAANRK